jgi:hypothetical protein
MMEVKLLKTDKHCPATAMQDCKRLARALCLHYYCRVFVMCDTDFGDVGAGASVDSGCNLLGMLVDFYRGLN